MPEPTDISAAPRIVALVPMRHDSERVVGKNYRPLGGRPLFHHVVDMLLQVPQITEVVIDTDSPVIAADAAETFPTVKVLERPVHLRSGETPMNDVLLNTIASVDADLYVQTHSTNPLLSALSVEAALETLLARRPEYDSLFTVTRLQTRLWTPDGQAINHDPAILLRTQDLPPVMEENSCLYVFDADTLRRRGNRIGERPFLYELDPHEAWDIDDEWDWTMAQALYEARTGQT